MSSGVRKDGVDDIREVLRRVSPYIIRQWKEVCRELDVPELEILQLEGSMYNVTPATLAYKGLCLWYDRSGRVASKDKLMGVLRKCGLRRAEEEIENTELGKVKVSTSSPRRPSSRVPSARRKSATVKADVKNGYTSRPASRNNVKTPRVRSSKKRNPTEDVKPCEIEIVMSVSRMIQEKDYNESWKDVFTEKCEEFYKFVTENSSAFIDRLENSLEIREVTVTEIRRGSLIICCQCGTLGALEYLNQSYRSKRLHAICQNVFVTGSVHGLLGTSEIVLDLNISSEALDAGREMFLARKFHECNIVHPTDLLAPPSDDLFIGDIPSPKGTEIPDTQIDEGRFRVDIQGISDRYRNFENQMKEFLRTINIILPKGRKNVASLQELIQLHGYLDSSTSVASGVRSDLVREYLAIVNNIRLFAGGLEDYLNRLPQVDSESEATCDSVPDNAVQRCLLSDIHVMLQPDYVFEEDISVVYRKLLSLERPFTGLMCYIPMLLEKVTTVIDGLP